MAVTGIESMNGDGMGVFARKNRLQVESTVVAGDPGDDTEVQVADGRLQTQSVIASAGGDPASVDGDGRLAVLALPDNGSRTISTGRFTVDDSAAVTIANSASNGESMVIQNQL